MTNYATPVTTAFQMQRATIEQSQQALQQGVEFQRRLNQAFLDSLDSQESVQRRGVEITQTALHNYLDLVEGSVPGMAGTVREVREAVDEQYEFLLENHAEAFEGFEQSYSEGADAFDDLSADYLEVVDEQLEMVLEAHEQLEDQSVEAVEQLSQQVDELQDQIEQVQEQAQGQLEA
jgi:gas vesicle protein